MLQQSAYLNRAMSAPAFAQVQVGVVVSWKPERGFGFIRSAGASEDVFVHVSQLGRAAELRAGQRVLFEVGRNEETGKREAQNVQLAN